MSIAKSRVQAAGCTHAFRSNAPIGTGRARDARRSPVGRRQDRIFGNWLNPDRTRQGGSRHSARGQDGTAEGGGLDAAGCKARGRDRLQFHVASALAKGGWRRCDGRTQGCRSGTDSIQRRRAAAQSAARCLSRTRRASTVRRRRELTKRASRWTPFPHVSEI